MNDRERIIFIIFSFLVFLLVIITSFFGYFHTGFYAKETAIWQVQSVGQDFINLFIVAPVLFISICFAPKFFSYAKFVLAGTLLYLTYTYVIYCFNIHFNQFFVFYCLIFGLSFYAVFYFLLIHIGKTGFYKEGIHTNRLTGFTFIIISALFYSLWLTEIIPSIANDSSPQNLAQTGLATNPVHVLDLAIVLPAIFITGILILKKKQLGYFLAPVLLVFSSLMNLTIIVLTIFIARRTGKNDLTLVPVMSVLTIQYLVLLILSLKKSRLLA